MTNAIEEPQLIQLQDVSKGGSYASGERVFFDGATIEGGVVRITVPTDSMGVFIQQLQAFTALAHDDRGDQAVAPGGAGPISAMTVRGLGIHLAADGSAVIIRVDMGAGIHVDVPLPVENIPQLIDAIRRRAREARRILKKRLH